jgi:hypothetical protein
MNRMTNELCCLLILAETFFIELFQTLIDPLLRLGLVFKKRPPLAQVSRLARHRLTMFPNLEQDVIVSSTSSNGTFVIYPTVAIVRHRRGVR